MDKWVAIPFASSLKSPRSPHSGIERLTNLYLERNPRDSRYPFTLYGTPGLKLWQTIGDGPIRGLHYLPPYLYVVSGNTAYAVSSVATVTEIGPVAGVGNVHMTSNRTHVAIAAPGHLYACNEGSGIFEVLPKNMSGATYQDGYGVFAESGTEQFWWTDVDDMLTIGGLSFSSADRLADQLVTARFHNGDLWLFGENSIEIWGIVATEAVFARQAGGSLDVGLSAEGGVAGARNVLFWPSQDGVIYMSQGYTPQPISPAWISHEVSKADSPASAWAFCYEQDGHVFYVLSYSNLTVVYDMTENSWHLRESSGMDRWRANAYARAFGMHLVGDVENGKLYDLDLDTYDEDGEEIRAELICPPLTGPGFKRLKMSEVILHMQSGVGLTDGQGSDPVIQLDWSDDDGRTWSNKHTASAGKIGERSRRVKWTRLGAFRQRSLRFAVADPVKRQFHGLDARIGVL